MIIDLRPPISSASDSLSTLHGATLYGWPIYDIVMALIAVFAIASLWNVCVAENIEYKLHKNDKIYLDHKKRDKSKTDKEVLWGKKDDAMHLKADARAYAALVITLGSFSLWTKPTEIKLTDEQYNLIKCLSENTPLITCGKPTVDVRTP